MHRTSAGIDAALGILGFHPNVTLIPLASSHLGFPIRAVRVRVGRRSDRKAVLLMAGLHARELLNPAPL